MRKWSASRKGRRSLGVGDKGIWITADNRIICLTWPQVSWIGVARDRWLQIYTTIGKKYFVPKPLKNLEETATRHGFVRIGRAILVSVAQIRELRRCLDGQVVIVKCGAGTKQLPVSRRKVGEIRRLCKPKGPREEKRFATGEKGWEKNHECRSQQPRHYIY